MAFADWVPWVLLGTIVLLIMSCTYMFKHKNEFLGLLGMSDGKGKKAKSRKFQKSKASKVATHHEDTPKSTPVPIAKTPSSKTPANTQPGQAQQNDDDSFSDLTIPTENEKIGCTTLFPSGALLVACGSGRDSKSFLFAIVSLDYNMSPLKQVFKLHETKVEAVTAMATDPFSLYYAADKSIFQKSISFANEDAQAELTLTLTFPNVYNSSVQALLSHPDGHFLACVVNHKDFRVFSPTGQDIFSQPINRDASFLQLSPDHTIAYIASGTKIVCFQITINPVTVTSLCTIDCPAAIVHMHVQKSTGFLFVATRDRMCTVYHKDINRKKPVQFQFHLDEDCRIISANPQKPFLAVISKTSQLSIYETKTGRKHYLFPKVHEGTADFITWSDNGKWIFFSSRQKPNIETFIFERD